MDSTITFIAVANAVSLGAGAVVTGLAYRAARRTGSPALRALAGGFGVITIGTLLGGVVHRLSNLPIRYGVVIQSTFTACGLLVVAYSLYAEGSDVADGRGEAATR